VSDEIVTRRLLLRRWTENDRPGFAAINADSEVMRYFPATLSAAESDAFVDRIEEGFDRDGFGLWAVELDGRLAGYTGLSQQKGLLTTGDCVEVGWRLARWAWGQGIATEAALAALRCGFEDQGLTEIFSWTTETNAPSEAVMLRIGLLRRPELDFDHPRLVDWWGRRHIVYSLRSEEWAVTHA